MYDQKCSGPFRVKSKLVLASKSPRRSELLKGLGLEFVIKDSQIIELDQSSGLTPSEMVRLNGLNKAMAVSAQMADSYVIGADTCVVIDGRILGKPKHIEEAKAMLNLLSGKWHKVFTGFTILNKEKELKVSKVVETSVLLYAFSQDVIEAYCLTNEPYDKAGGYAVQAVGGFMIKEIRGSYTNVVGLPVSELVECLLELGVISPCVKN